MSSSANPSFLAPGLRPHLVATCILHLVTVLFLAACGFTPLYGTAGDKGQVTAGLTDVYIDNIPDREGQYLRNALIDRFYLTGRPDNALYSLTVAPISESSADLDITKSSDATRAQLRLATRMLLTDRATGKLLLERNLTSITSYNVLQSQFTTRVSEQNARENALDDLARQIEQQLALYFRRQ